MICGDIISIIDVFSTNLGVQLILFDNRVFNNLNTSNIYL